MPTRRQRKQRKIPGKVAPKSVSAMGAVRSRKSGNTMHKPGVILPLNRENIITDWLDTKPQSNQFREGKYLHVSDLLSKCMRMVALSDQTETRIMGEPLWDNWLVTYAIGNAIHDFVTSKATSSMPHSVYGSWSCACSKKVVTGTKNEAVETGTCEVCDTPLDKYGEVVLTNDEIMVCGSVDLTLVTEGAYYFTEIKSIKKEDWDTLVRPIPLHIIQIVFYWWLARELKWPIYKQVSIIYVTKGHAYRSPYKELVIDPEEHIHRLDDYIEEAKELLAAKRGGPLPCRVCPQPESPQAKKCSMTALCFSMGD